MNKFLKYIIISIISLLIGYSIAYYILTDTNSVKNIYESLVHISAYYEDSVSNASGFVYKTKNNKAYIVTSYHVVEGSSKIYILSKNKKEKASLIGYDIDNDVAVLSMPNKLNLKVASIGNSNNIEVGDEIFVGGSPVGNRYIDTITHGIVSYINREIKINTSNGESFIKMIQIDAFINPGNSGGPLITKKGDVIGLVSIKEANAEGVGFAIPINFVTKCIHNIEKSIEY